MTYAFSLIFFTIIVVAWIWSDHAERKEQRRELWPQPSAWHIVSPPFDWKESEDL